ncbi:helix-turn-helix domain-containing protein [Deinococcus wulumuqiensis]|uniref:XRE family transcriptional regulator n=1 Tax=Deinococcus wulumuqiensis TaxID=980427 RepID=A0AAV4K6I2_9DEIO|nr:helix-turn-helix domain-containing protein [Deinococcus wulumuqiensis]QII20157.1 helix-turn-helix transcriptional regulator [Deinococcus wulumuqiensis R12]GGI75633.1 hypothetical protein GCM10010914_07310 [Deinococcus wulumuqiensis]GGP28747.1 hypothetical protein GCM10008021_03980 [Deinococcus wulumuqiensis]
MGQVIRSHLGAVLEQHGITAYKLSKAIAEAYGDQAIKQQTVYAVVKGNGVPDARTLNQIITALRGLTGRELQVGDLLDWVPDSEVAS